MNDLISRQEAIRIAEQGQVQGYEWQFKKLCELPSVQPRKGKWIEHDDDWANVYYECSVCKEPFVLIDGTPTENLYNFCPNCGADMREGEQDDN